MHLRKRVLGELMQGHLMVRLYYIMHAQAPACTVHPIMHYSNKLRSGSMLAQTAP